jgi:YHS domain-containing protein
MKRWQWFGAMAFVGVILLTSWLSSAILAQQPRLEYPLPGPGSCVPNIMTWGHYEPQWRRWPGEVRLEQINPHAPDATIIPTPEGREIIPPPKATIQVQPQPGQPGQKQPPPSKKEEESMLPPGGTTLRGMEGTNVPLTPGSENKPGAGKPTIEGDLPGLGPEPEPNKPLLPPSNSPSIPAANPPAKTPAKAPAKSPADQSPKTSRWEDGPKPGSSPSVTADWPAQQMKIGSVGQEARWNNAQPSATVAGGTKGDGIVALAGGMEPERNATLPAACRADAIGVTADSSTVRLEPAAYAVAESAPKPAPVNHAALPSVALGGYCPVELSRNRQWVLGDLRWTVVYNGWIYRLSGAEQRREFLADPDRFAPVNSGNDVVLSVTNGGSVPGQTAYCAIYGNRLYMFSNEATQAEFNKNPERYVVRK